MYYKINNILKQSRVSFFVLCNAFLGWKTANETSSITNGCIKKKLAAKETFTIQKKLYSQKRRVSYSTIQMDKYRIVFQCHTVPNAASGLQGYKLEEHYIGRMFNGLCEMSPQWGSDIRTKLIPKTLFDQYFAIIKHNEQPNEK